MDFVNENTHSIWVFPDYGNGKDRTKNNGYLWHGELARSGAVIGIEGLGGDNIDASRKTYEGCSYLFSPFVSKIKN